MKIVEQAHLGFREGNSDKVYEVELVEVAPGQCVVNFRYGRRGTALRDGTKTPLPVTLEQARSVFSALVADKAKKGYKPTSVADAGSAPAPARPKVDRAANQARTEQALIEALRRGRRSALPLHLVVRKVGERGLKAAEPELLELLASRSAQSNVKPEVLRHWLIAALARCGTARAIGPLRSVVDDRKAPRHLRDVALLALTMIGGAEERRRARATVPTALQPDPSSDLQTRVAAAERLLADNPEQARSAIWALYASTPLVFSVAATDADARADQVARRIVLSAARIARMTGAELGLLRALNWAAELRRDGELYALLTRRFEIRGAAAASDTMNYLRRRATRTLRRLGSIGSPDYVKMSTELLLLYHDADAEDVIQSDAGTWDAFGRYHALNFVLYGNSSRYGRAGHRRATWRCRNGYAPGSSGPARREESYPELWDKDPAALWRIGISDATGIVILFATRALRDQGDYLARVADAELAAAMSRAQLPMRQLAFDVARMRTPNIVLARGAMASDLDAACAWVLGWVERTPGLLREQSELFALLVTARSPRVRDAVARLSAELVLDGALAQDLVATTIAILIELTETLAENERAESAAAFLLQRTSDALAGLGDALLRDLLAHPLSGVALLGAELVRRRAKKGPLAEGLLDTLLGSQHAAVRSIGASIVASTPPEVMKNEPELLVSFALSDNAELRSGTRSLIVEVARLYPEVGSDVAAQLIDALLKRQPEGAPAHVMSLLRRELAAYLPKRSAAQILTLIGAFSPHAREAGGLLLVQVGPDDLDLDAMVRLANHEILSIRQGAWSIATSAKDRFRIAPVALARLCDARWEDSRAFAFEFVRSFPAEQLVPDTVIAICDSANPAVQRFGQTLLLEHWREDHAERYLLRLSEHPSTNIQLLVSGLLGRYAHGNLALLERLLPCLTTVLSQVNRAGVAKQRVIEFLRQESVACAEAAALIAPLLERQSLTRAVSHKGSIIATMVNLHERYPAVPVPIAVQPAAQQNRSRRGV